MNTHSFCRVSIVLLCLLLLICNSALAAKSNMPARNTLDMPEPLSERRSPFEFCELHIKHLYDAEKITGLDIVSHSIGSLYSFIDWNENDFWADCSGVSMKIDKEDFLINEVSFVLSDSIADEDSQLASIYSAAASIAALEYDDLTDGIVELTYDLGLSDIRNTTEWAENLIIDHIIPTISTEYSVKIMAAGKSVLVHMGNYTYYASYGELSHNGETHGYTLITAKHK